MNRSFTLGFSYPCLGKDQQKALLVATGYGSTFLQSVEILTRNINGNYTSRQVAIGGCSDVADFPIATLQATAAFFNDLPQICVGYKPGDPSNQCFGLSNVGLWENTFNLTRPLAYGGSSVAFGEGGDNTTWWFVGGDPSGKETEAWEGNPPAEIINGMFGLPNTINTPCMTKISNQEAFVTAIPKDVQSETNFAWIFNLKTHGWKRVNDTLKQRSDPACGFIKTDLGRFIVLAGGYQEKTTEILNLDTLEWTMGPSFEVDMKGGRLVSVQNSEELILIGGTDDSTVFNEIRKMNQSMSGWDTVGHLTTPRFDAVVLDVLVGDLPPLCN